MRSNARYTATSQVLAALDEVATGSKATKMRNLDIYYPVKGEVVSMLD